ncbi:aspartate/glutamate racemase family protein, partial [Erysipelotrichaceae bacterium OttesenSCG-928-M19]|nr:aspartate/glutamate racemase family protein [Erysipelotrichaceae bacterium OttesenSCG-928-M19]
MKTIGLIGGISWESSAHYYEIINKEINQRLGGHHFARCILYSVDFADIVKHQEAGEWDECAKILCQAALNLEKAGADFIGLCTNTSHKAALEIEQCLTIPFYHIATLTANRLEHDQITKVGLLGTRFTMEEAFYKDKLVERGIEVLIPNQEGIKDVNTMIFEELCFSKVLSTSKQRILIIIQELVEAGAQGIILGCTELNMLVNQNDVMTKLYDTTLIHAQELVNLALKDE